jgi:hypothetical protein
MVQRPTWITLMTPQGSATPILRTSDVGGSGVSLFEVTTLTLAWRDLEKLRKPKSRLSVSQLKFKPENSG